MPRPLDASSLRARVRPAALAMLVACVTTPAAVAQLVFGPPTPTALPLGTPARFATGDVNLDGFDDLVVGHTGAPGLRLGDGSGAFGPESLIATDTFGTAVLLTDLTHDGRPDLLVGTSVSARLHVAVAQAGGGFLPATSYVLGVTTPSANFLLLDERQGNILATTVGPFGGPAGEARIFRSAPDGSLALVNVIPPGAPPDRLAGGLIGDLTGDARADVVLVHNAGTGFPDFSAKSYVCQPDDSFLQVWMLPGGVPAKLGGIDLVDNHLDLLTLGSPSGQTTAVAHFGVGDGSFVPGPATVFGPALGLSIAAVHDLDQDYIPDLVAVSTVPAELWILRGTGFGTFVENARVSLAAGTNLAGGAGMLGNFDGDGHLSFDVLAPVGMSGATPSVKVCFNRTYHHGAPPLDLGQQLKGTSWPIQIAVGSFVAGQPFAFELHAAVPSGSAFLVLGLSQLNAPFKGGTMVPNHALISGPWPVSAAGTLSLGGPAWPSLPLGLQLWLQYWFPDAGGPAGFAASSALQLTAP